MGFDVEFALSPGTVQDREQNSPTPDRMARVLLRVIERKADAVRGALRENAVAVE